MAYYKHPPVDPRLLHFSHELRANATDAESPLWKLLRNRQLEGRKFRRQHPVAGFILDFYCPEARVGIELDGGGHTENQQAEYDTLRTQVLASEGIQVLRFWNNQVMVETEAVIQEIWEAVHARVE